MTEVEEDAHRAKAVKPTRVLEVEQREKKTAGWRWYLKSRHKHKEATVTPSSPRYGIWLLNNFTSSLNGRLRQECASQWPPSAKQACFTPKDVFHTDRNVEAPTQPYCSMLERGRCHSETCRTCGDDKRRLRSVDTHRLSCKTFRAAFQPLPESERCSTTA